jgi:WhiB family transcriptional regulator, redox-sensing transcriptional regulator
LSAVDWHDRAACKGQPDAMFFDATGDIAGRARPGVRLTRWYAKQFCARCPVARACHLYAEDTRADFGVFGGLDQYERRLLRVRKDPIAIAMIAHRMNMDGWPEDDIAAALSVSPEELVQLTAEYPATYRRIRAGLAEYRAWRDVMSGAPAYLVASRHRIPQHQAEEMCRACDKFKPYRGPKAKGRAYLLREENHAA